MIINKLTLAFFFGNFDLLAVFVQPYFYIVGGFLLFLLVALIAWFIDEQIKKKNAVLRKEEHLPEIAAKFGKAISVSADALRFERNETIFDAKIKSVETGEIPSTEFEVRFNLPNLQEKFFIQHKSAFSKYGTDCEPLLLSAMPNDFIFHSLNSQFLLTLLEKKKILTELDKYPSSWLNQFMRIAFENNVFIISWGFIGLEERNKAEKLEQVCQTAVVFYDELGGNRLKIMRNLTTFILIGVIFVSAMSAQNTVVPIVYGETLIGGAQNGKWITAEKTNAQLKDKTEFKILSFNGFKKGSIFGTKDDDRGVCTETPMITFEEPEEYENDNDSSPFAIGANAKWNPVPRIPRAIGLKDKTYTKIVADFLKTKGIAKTKIKITQAYRIDLEGDGQNEIIIAGNYYKKAKDGEEIAGDGQQSAGDYSFVLLRKIVKGKPQNILIEGDFYTSKLLRSGEYPMPSMREITAIADLNGDGKMEFVLLEIYYEGNRTAVFEIKNGKPVKVLEAECSV